MAGPGVLVAALSIGLGWPAWPASGVWWLQPAHRISLVGTLLNSVVLVYITCYPVFFVVAANRLRNVRKSVAVPLLRVAFVVTRAPSEPWDVARATLTAMLGQEFPLPYDVWICDEAPTAEIIDWCDSHGVTVASRNGRQKYHRTTWPRRTKCKEGNLAYFYDHWGYRSYDVVAQLDCDHRPSPTYLSEMVRPVFRPGGRVRRRAQRLRRERRTTPGPPAGACTGKPPSTARSSWGTATAGRQPASAPTTRSAPGPCATSAESAPNWPRTSPPASCSTRRVGMVRSPSTPRRTVTAPTPSRPCWSRSSSGPGA